MINKHLKPRFLNIYAKIARYYSLSYSLVEYTHITTFTQNILYWV